MVELKTVETVDTSPFKKLVITIGELPTSFVESMTYYECLAWLVNYIQNTVIPAVNNNGEAVTELQEKFVELKTFVDTYFDNLDVQEEINNKLDAMVEDGTLTSIISTFLYKKLFLASELGMVTTNSEAAATSNFTILKNAMEAGYNVLIDDVYYIKNTNPENSIQLITNQTLQGKDKDCKLVIYDNNYFYLFDHNNFDLSLINLTVDNQYGHESYLIKDNSTSEEVYKYGSIYINGCRFIGDIRIIEFYNQESNLRDATWGVPEIKFNNNFVENCKDCVSIIDYNTPFGEVEINNNIIHNTFCFARIHPTHDESDAQGQEFLRTLRADGNQVYNDDDVFNDTGTYCAFIVMVGNECIVTNNTIKGLKSNGNTAVYAVYASCINFVFDNNTCENIVNFKRNDNNYVFKAKYGYGYRKCSNNTFTLDATWVASINESLASPYSEADLLAHTTYRIYHSDGPQVSWLIDNNKIKVLNIDNGARYRDVKYFTFTNNTVSCNTFTGYLFYPQTNNVVTKINGNTFVIENSAASGEFTVVQGGSYNSTCDVEICNNNIFANTRRTQLIASSGSFGNCVIDNNNIYDKSSSASTSASARSLYIEGSYASLKIDSTFLSNNKTPMNRVRIGDGKLDITEHINSLAMSDNGGSERFVFSKTALFNNKLMFTIEYLNASDQLITCHSIIEFYTSGESLYAKFTDSSDNQQDINVTELAANNIKGIKADNGSSMVTFSGRASGDSYITFNNVTANAKYAVIKINSI